MERQGMRKRFAACLAMIAVLMGIFASPRNVYAALQTNVRIAFVPNNPPYQFLQDGEPVGMHIDLLEAMAKESNMTLEFIPVSRMDVCFEMLENYQCDVVMGVTRVQADGFSITEQNLSQTMIALLVDKPKMEQLKNKEKNVIRTLVYENRTIPTLAEYYHLQVAAGYAQTVTRIVSSCQQEAFETLIEGRADGLLGSRTSMIYQLYQKGLENDYAIYYGNVASLEYGIAARAENISLLQRFDRAIADLRTSGSYDSIEREWIIEDLAKELTFEEVWRAYGWIAALILLIAITIFLFFFQINRFLKKQIALQTRELRKLNEDLSKSIEISQYESRVRELMIAKNPNGVIMLDKDMRITQINQAARKMIGSEGNPLGDGIFRYPLTKAVMEKKDIFYSGKEYLDTLTGGTRDNQKTYQYNLVPLKERGKVISVLLVLSDITDKMWETERMIEGEKNRILNMVVTGIAHEIRNPLMVLKSFSQLIKVRKDSQEFVQKFSDMVPQEVDRINRLVEDLIHFSRKSKVEKQQIDVRQMVEFCLRLLEMTMQKPWMEIHYDIEPGLVLFANEDQMKQVLLNALLNACQAIEEKVKLVEKDAVYRIDINGWSGSRMVYIQIRDEGMGMDEQTLQHVTEPFYTTKATGTGMGMAVSKSYVEENDGSIRFESEVGKYTVMTLAFKKGVTYEEKNTDR